jgi:hypothetical protein
MRHKTEGVDDEPAEERPEAGPESKYDQKDKGPASQVGPDDLFRYFLGKNEHVKAKGRDKDEKGDDVALDPSTERPKQRLGWGDGLDRKIVPAQPQDRLADAKNGFTARRDPALFYADPRL